MSEITPHTLTQVIVYHDGTFKMISEPQASLIFQASTQTDSKSIVTQNLGLVVFSSIAKIISVKDFYEQYPQHRPETPRDFTPEYKLLNQVRQPTKEALDLMKKGFIQQRMYGNASYTREQELLEFNEPRMTKEQAEKELKEFKVKSI